MVVWLQVEGYKFQATLAWPQSSKKPAAATSKAIPGSAALDEQVPVVFEVLAPFM